MVIVIRKVGTENICHCLIKNVIGSEKDMKILPYKKQPYKKNIKQKVSFLIKD